jgi:hypothetical protein
MFSYHQVKAIQDYRFGRYRQGSDAATGRRRRPAALGDLLTALAGSLAGLGIREDEGKRRPASPAY